MKIKLNGKEIISDKPVRISDLFENKDYHYGAAKVNHRLR